MDLNNLLTEYLKPESKYQLGTYHPNLGRFTRDIYYLTTPSHPVLTSITPVSKILTYITHTHPKIKSDAILGLRAH